MLDYIINALLAIIAVSLWMIIGGVMCWFIEELLPKLFSRLKSLLDEDKQIERDKNGRKKVTDFNI